jgi:signal transduction histidine kinase
MSLGGHVGVRSGLPGLALVSATAAVAIAPVLVRDGQPGSTYASVSRAADATGLLAVLCLLLGAVVVAVAGGSLALASLLCIATVSWLAPDLVGWQDGPPLARTLGEVVRPLGPVVLLGLVAVELRTRPARWAFFVAAGVGGSAAVVRSTVLDPFLDPGCWANCSVNSFLVHRDQSTARTLGVLLSWLAVGCAVASLLLVTVSWRSLTRTHRLSVAALALLAAGELAWVVAAVRGRESAQVSGFVDGYVGRAVLWSLVGIAVAGPPAAAARGRARLRQVTSDLSRAPAPGTLASNLAERLGDPELEVVYPMDDGRYVDGRGQDQGTPIPAPGRVVTPLRRGDRTVALVEHASGVLASGSLDEHFGPSARLAVDNERLAAELLVQVRDLQDSRARVVASTDASRRALERDLHDGAQQSLLALSFELRMARAAADRAGDFAGRSLLDGALAETTATIEELRELAHGIHPAVLTESGLAVALPSLADRASIPVYLCDVPTGRLPPAVERAAYAFVADVVTGAEASRVTSVSVAFQRRDGVLVVTAEPCVAVAEEVADRVEALTGTVESSSGAIRVVVPCV